MLLRSFILFLLLCGSALAQPVLVLGDSLSAEHNLPRGSGWVALLEDRLQSEFDQPPEVVNASISGETSAGALRRLPALLATHKPGVVVVELGGNDGLRGLPPGQLRANLERIVALSKDAGAQVLLLGMDLPPNYGTAYRKRFTSVYRELADDQDIVLLPFLLEGVALSRGMMQVDGVHPTAAAQPRLLENVWPRLRPLLAGSELSRGRR
jgi:acyl-CoA thioesterase I